MTQPSHPPQQGPQAPPPPSYGQYPPTPEKRKALGTGGIIAIITSSLLAVLLIAMALYFFVLRQPEQPRLPSITVTSKATDAPPSSTTPLITVETEPERPLISVFERRLSELDAYEMQSLGANPVAYYQHPTLDVAIDLRGEREASRMMYVIPTATGFIVTHRQTIAYEYVSLRDYSASMELIGVHVNVSYVSASDKEQIEQDNEKMIEEGIMFGYTFVPYGEGYFYIWDNTGGGPDSTWIANELNGSEVYIDASYIAEHLIASLWPGVEVDECEGDAAAEWENVLRMLRNNPAEFEWRYALPPYAAYPDSNFQPNWALSEDLLIELFYEHGTIDLNGDGIPEHIVHCAADSYDYAHHKGYWAVFTETTGGLKLIGFSVAGDSDLIYSNEHLYVFQQDGKMGDYMLFVEEQSLPVPAAEYRPVFMTEFRTLDVIMAFEEAGELDPYLDLSVVPKRQVYDKDDTYLEFFAADANEFTGMISALKGALSDGFIVAGRSAYDAGPGEKVSRLQTPELIGESYTIIQYLENTFSYLPFNDNEWVNATRVADLVADGTAITYEKAERMLPYPSLLD